MNVYFSITYEIKLIKSGEFTENMLQYQVRSIFLFYTCTMLAVLLEAQSFSSNSNLTGFDNN